MHSAISLIVSNKLICFVLNLMLVGMDVKDLKEKSNAFLA